MANKDLQIIISAIDKATAPIKKIGDNLSWFAERNKASFQKMAIWWTAAFWAIIAISKKTTDAFKEQERAEARLEQIARQVSGATDEQIQWFKNLASELQKVGVVWDEVIISWQSQLASFTKNADVVALLSKDLADLAVATYWVDVSQEQAIQTANMLWKAMTWQLWAMTRAWILVSDEYAEAFEKANTEMERAEIISKIVSENYGWVNEAMRNTAEWWAQALTNAWGDMQEVIWQAIIPALNNLMASLQPIIETATKWISENQELVAWIIKWGLVVTWVVTVLWTLWLALIPIIATIKTVIITVKALWVALAFLAANPIWMVIVAIGALVAAVVWLIKNWDTIWPKVEEVWVRILWAWENIKNVMLTIWNALWDWVKNVMQMAVDWLFDKFEWLKNFIEGIIWFATGAFDKVKSIWESAKNIAGSIGSSISGAVWWAKDFVTWARELWWPVSANKTYLVWERWPELFTPATSWRINNQTWWYWNITINMWWVVVNNEADENRLIEKMKRVLIRETQLFNNWIA